LAPAVSTDRYIGEWLCYNFAAGSFHTNKLCRDVNETRSGRGQEHEAEANAHGAKVNSHEAEAEAKIALIFQPKFTF